MKKRATYHIYLLLIVFGLSISQSPLFAQENDKFVVVLDAGHGGHDPGTRGNGYKPFSSLLSLV